MMPARAGGAGIRKRSGAGFIPRAAIFGTRVGDPPKDESEHFIHCPALQWLDRLP